jgi:lysine decarboxylase
VSAESAAGRVAAETIAPYPPGIPAIAPGEVIAGTLLEALRAAAAEGTRIAYCADPTLTTVQVVAR